MASGAARESRECRAVRPARTAVARTQTTAAAMAKVRRTRPRYGPRCRSSRRPFQVRRDPRALRGAFRTPARTPPRSQRHPRRSRRPILAPAFRYRIPSIIPSPRSLYRMIAPLVCQWSGVFPAATTQFDVAGNVDIAATQAVQAALVRDGVHGLVLLGTVGENNSLSAEEKRAVLRAAVAAVGGKVPLLTGVSENTTAAAATFARDAERIGVNGLMVLPAMVYVPTTAELEQHFKSVAQASALPIMLYNNPPAYRVSIEFELLERLAELPTIVAIKESSPDPRRFTDVINQFAERFVLFAGLDDIVFEGLILGAKGWVSGLTNAFPAESLALYAAIRGGDLARARAIYRW